MRAVRYEAPRKFAVRDLPDPLPGPGEVRVAVTMAGCCGTDWHIHEGGFFAAYPLTPGHEIVGEVDLLGPSVEGLRLGSAVAVDNTVLCGRCVNCRRGKPLFCKNFHSLGVTDDGGFATYVIAAAEKCYPIPTLSMDEAVLIEPLACVVHGMDVLGLAVGSQVCVLGAGPTGLLLAQLLVHGGASRVVVAAPSAFKLELARHFGVDETLQITRGEPDATVRALARLAPEGFDAVVEATGASEILERCPQLARDGGTVLVYGMVDEAARVPFDAYALFKRELTVKGSFAQVHCFDRAIAALTSHRVKADGIVTHRFSIERFGEALQAMHEDPSCLKAAIVP